MSASLVGSEMCIRDSGWTHHMSAPSGPLAGTCHALANCLIKLHCRCPPVSYTHLTLPTICSV
eukprot:8882187-Alexandrium_andersonii.AAC.1